MWPSSGLKKEEPRMYETFQKLQDGMEHYTKGMDLVFRDIARKLKADKPDYLGTYLRIFQELRDLRKFTDFKTSFPIDF